MTEGRQKEGELSCNYVSGPNLNICIEKVDAKCLLVEMTLVMTSLPLTRFSMLVYIRADWRKSDSSVEFKFQRRSWKERPGELAPRLMIRQNKSHI